MWINKLFFSFSTKYRAAIRKKNMNILTMLINLNHKSKIKTLILLSSMIFQIMTEQSDFLMFNIDHPILSS
jgi:hypothetical protein